MKEIEKQFTIAEMLIPRTEKADPSECPDAPFIGLDDIEAHTTKRIGVKRSGEMRSAAKRFYDGDVLYSRLRPYLNKVWTAERNGLCSSEFIVLPSNKWIDSKFLTLRLSSRDFVAFANSLDAGDRPRVNFEQISSFCLPPFSLSHQRRIVAKIEELFSEIDAGVASLKTARAQLGVYRQSLLKQAFEGKLTEKWRAQNPDKLEPAEQLLARIRSEREARYQQQLTDWQTAVQEWKAGGEEGKKPSKPKKPRGVELLSEDELAKMSKLPLGLCWVKFGSLIDDPAYGTSKKCSYESTGRGVLRIPNLVEGIIDDRDLKFASFTEEEEKNYQLIDGDLLLIRSNGSVSIVGRCVRVSQKHTKHLYAGYLIRMRPIHSVTDPDFIRMQLSSSALRNQIESFAKSTSGVNNINAKEIQALVVSLCSLPEQQEIVRILEEQFTAIEQNEQEIDAALQRAEALRQSILKKGLCRKTRPTRSQRRTRQRPTRTHPRRGGAEGSKETGSKESDQEEGD